MSQIRDAFLSDDQVRLQSQDFITHLADILLLHLEDLAVVTKMQQKDNNYNADLAVVTKMQQKDNNYNE
jgi:hypothetical protein